jgi:signal transduction histidine kinase
MPPPSPVARLIGGRGSPAPLVVVAVALIALVVVPLTAEWYTRPLFDELRSLTTPAQQLVTRVHVGLALRGSTVRDFVQTGNPALAARYRDVAAHDSVAHARLGEIVGRLGPLVRQRYAALRDADRRWDDAAEGVFDSVKGPDVKAADREQLYENALIAAARLDEALDGAVHSRRARIRDAVRLQRQTSVALSALALVALAAVAVVARRLRAAVAEAEEGRRAVERVMESKARLMRGVSHDIKNPLNAIAGFAALLDDGVGGGLSAEQRRCVERIRVGVRTVLALVDDLLELARADVGRLRVACRPTDLRSVVLEAVDEHRIGAQAREHTLEVNVPEELPTLTTDPSRVRQILGNLLSNAIKYTPRGGRIGVEVTIGSRPQSPSARSWLAVHVADTGPGIPAQQREAVFDEFTRLDRTGQRGSGLGLAIARRVARLLGGDLTLESEVGRGSQFTLWLPVASPAGERRTAQEPRPGLTPEHPQTAARGAPMTQGGADEADWADWADRSMSNPSPSRRHEE